MKINTRALVGTMVGTVGVTLIAIIVKSLLLFAFHNQDMKSLLFNPNTDFIVDYKERIINAIIVLGAILAMVYESMKIIPSEYLKQYGRIVIIFAPIIYILFFSEGMFAPKWGFLCVFSVLGMWYHFRDKRSRKEAMIGLTLGIVGGAIISELITIGGMKLSKGQLIEFLTGVEAESNIKQALNYTHYYIYQGLGITAFLAFVYFGFKRIPARHYKWTFLFTLSVLPLLHSDLKLKVVAAIGFLAIYFYLRKEMESETELSLKSKDAQSVSGAVGRKY